MLLKRCLEGCLLPVARISKIDNLKENLRGSHEKAVAVFVQLSCDPFHDRVSRLLAGLLGEEIRFHKYSESGASGHI